MFLRASHAWLTVLQEQVSPRSPSSGSNQYRQLGFGVANRLTDSQSNLIGERFAEPSLCSSRSLLKPFVTLSLIGACISLTVVIAWDSLVFS